MEIGNPIALYFLALAGLAALLFVYEIAWARRTMASFAGRGIMGKVLKGFSRRRRIARRILIVAALVLLILAWAMPRVGRGMRVIYDRALILVDALHITASVCEPGRKQARCSES